MTKQGQAVRTLAQLIDSIVAGQDVLETSFDRQGGNYRYTIQISGKAAQTKSTATDPQHPQAGADAPKPCAKCIYNELGGPHPIDCRNCIHGPAQIDKFNPMRTASAC